jgi:cysteine-rich repeat protein
VATVETSPSHTDFDSLIYVREGACGGPEIDCDDAYGEGGESLTVETEANTDYFVFVDGFSGEQGAYRLDVTFTPSVCGNGAVEAGEECDDGNIVAGDGCSAQCAFESACAGLAEMEPNTSTSPQMLPAACGTVRLTTATLPRGDTDYYQLSVPGDATIVAETFRSAPGYCDYDTDTVLSLWRAPIPAGSVTSGSCTDDAG